MKLFEKQNQNKLSKLESEILRASEHELTDRELNELEDKLEQNPDLKKVYKDVTSLPDFSKAYDTNLLKSEHLSDRVVHLLDLMESEESLTKSFASHSIQLFKRYALAASIIFLALTSSFYFSQSGDSEADYFIEELLYPMEESDSETYVYYLEQLFEQD